MAIKILSEKGKSMKRVLLGLLCPVLALGMFAGCAKETRTASAAATEILSAQPETSQSSEPFSENSEIDTASPLPISADADLKIEKGLRIAVVAKSTEGDYWKQMKKQMKETAAYFNEFYGLAGEDAIQVTFEGPDSEADIDVQINTIDAVLAENPSVLCLAAIDMNSCQAQLETAQDNGIPVVLFDSGVKYSADAAFCATDNKAAGAEAAKKLCAAISENGTAAVFAHASYTQTSKDRIQGFRREIHKNHPNVTIAGVYTEDREADMQDAIRNVLENGQTDAIFCTNQTIAEQVLAIQEEYPENTSAIVGFDAGETQLAAIQEGRELGTIVQNIPLIASQTIQAAVCAASPKQTDNLEKYLKADYFWTDRYNLEQAEQAGLLY